MTIQDPLEMGSFGLLDWIEDHKEEMQPPIGNTIIWEQTEGVDFLAMAIRGPNRRRAFHTGPSPELFYQLEGTAHVEILRDPEDQARRELITLEAGDTFMLPTGVPHNPRRTPGSVGIVIELFRDEEEVDVVAYYCPECNGEVHRELIHEDFGRNIQRVATAFQDDEEARTCPDCGHVMAPQADPWTLEAADEWEARWGNRR
ncbi:MAG: 3-hydroxyanthranilate 3,4-dioxygenase [Halobacteriales archaeon]|nr:3-hydroxyanthranilate 3,4-dioxygenase [Halobacteriales archaeon]